MKEKKLTLASFNTQYWYKNDLKKYCVQWGLLSHGTKAELESRIKKYLSTGEKELIKKRASQNLRRIKNSGKQAVTLDMPLIPGGFRFNQVSRDFLSHYFSVKQFKFTKEMASALREAEKRGDQTMTVLDLIHVYKTTQSQKKKGTFKSISNDEKSLQWNQFVKDFSKDSRASQFKNRLKVAAQLWKVVRTSKQLDRRYQSEMLTNYLSEYQKKGEVQ